MNKLFLSIILLLLAYSVQAEALYRSIDENGNIQYGDRPAPNAVDTEKLNATKEPTDDDTLSFEARRASSKFPVTMYVADGCGSACTDGRDYLKKRGIPFTERKLVATEDIEAFRKSSGGNQVPAIHIGADWLSGFSEIVWSQALDGAGYPKNAPYGRHSKSAASTEKP